MDIRRGKKGLRFQINREKICGPRNADYRCFRAMDGSAAIMTSPPALSPRRAHNGSGKRGGRERGGKRERERGGGRGREREGRKRGTEGEREREREREKVEGEGQREKAEREGDK